MLAFYAELENSPLRLVGCTREDCAGFAADAYARINGIGAVCVTYCVGGLSLCNSIAGAYAEKSPVVVISGAPGAARAFQQSAAAPQGEGLSHPGRGLPPPLRGRRRAGRPAHGLPRDRPRAGGRGALSPAGLHRIAARHGRLRARTAHTRPVARAAPATRRCWPKPSPRPSRRIAAGQRPVILADVEIHRFGLQDELLALAEGAGIPIAATMLGKSVVSERHPLFVGIYEGAMGREEVTQFVEESDCVIMLGEFMTDINLGIYTANLDPARCIYATSESLRISHHHFDGVLLGDFIDGLIAAGLKAPPRPLPPRPGTDDEPFQLQPRRPITITRLIARLNQSLDETMVVIADPGDALFASSDLVIRRQTEFLSPAYYTSMGFAVPAALGVMVARPACGRWCWWATAPSR